MCQVCYNRPSHLFLTITLKVRYYYLCYINKETVTREGSSDLFKGK